VRTAFLAFLLTGATRSFAEELLYAQPLGEYSRTAEGNAEARRDLDQLLMAISS
jgi:hypothetical protein